MISEAELIGIQKRAFSLIERVEALRRSPRLGEQIDALLVLALSVSDDVDALAECIAHLQRKLAPERAIAAGAVAPIPEEDLLT